VLGTFLEAIFESLFGSSFAFLLSVPSQSAVPLILISVAGTGKNQLEPGEESMGDALVLSNSSLLRNPSPKPTGVLEH